jgi:hypothetical protein
MDVGSLEQLKRVWSNPRVPVLYRRGPGNPLLARLPYASTNRSWLQESGRKKPVWLATKKYWELPQAWFSDLVKRCLDNYGRVYIIQPFRAQEKCAPACWNAEGEICECSCMGANHGSSYPGGRWKIVSETFATRWGERELACRLLTRAV